MPNVLLPLLAVNSNTKVTADVPVLPIVQISSGEYWFVLTKFAGIVVPGAAHGPCR